MASPEAFFFFFFSSRRRHTRCSRDWSSDVCSSDLWVATAAGVILVVLGLIPKISAVVEGVPRAVLGGARSEERRVGKECRCRWSAEHYENRINTRPTATLSYRPSYNTR